MGKVVQTETALFYISLVVISLRSNHPKLVFGHLHIHYLMLLVFISSPRIRHGFVPPVSFPYAPPKKISPVVTATFTSTLNAVSWPIWLVTRGRVNLVSINALHHYASSSSKRAIQTNGPRFRYSIQQPLSLDNANAAGDEQ